MSSQLTLRAVTKAYAFTTVLDAVDCTIRPGERVGIVGDNGAGKSTLLRLIARVENPDSGEVTVAAQGVGYLAQTLPSFGTVGDVGPGDLRSLRLDDPEQLAEFERRDGYTAEARLRQTMAALGVNLPADRPLNTLSGGERARLALAAVLAGNPELLLLDEPTNHLDEAAMEWLERRLQRHRGTVVLVTHDRLLLDRVCTAILEVDHRTVTRHGNGYAGYLAAHRAARRRWEDDYQRWTDEIARWTNFPVHEVAPGRPRPDNNKCKYNGDGRRVQAAIRTRARNVTERLDRLHADPVPRPPDPLHLATRFATSGSGRRVVLDGPNGSGKSTLLRALAERSTAGYLPQESPPADGTLLEAFGLGEARLAALGLFRTEDFEVPVHMLSVGQRRRLDLARLLATDHDVLLLDEPTNHLSPALAEELTAALLAYPGTLIIATHDRALKARLA